MKVQMNPGCRRMVLLFVEFMYDLIQCKVLCERDKIVALKLCVQT